MIYVEYKSFTLEGFIDKSAPTDLLVAFGSNATDRSRAFKGTSSKLNSSSIDMIGGTFDTYHRYPCTAINKIN